MYHGNYVPWELCKVGNFVCRKFVRSHFVIRNFDSRNFVPVPYFRPLLHLVGLYTAGLQAGQLMPQISATIQM
jgi:hypothetical protein